VQAKIEPLAGVIRVFDQGKAYGDPYRFIITVKWLDPETVELIGATQAPTPSEWRAIKEALIAGGVKFVTWVRKSGANPRTVRLSAVE
jgi:hypothetical protein